MDISGMVSLYQPMGKSAHTCVASHLRHFEPIIVSWNILFGVGY
jgi:hypothetical protein